MAKKKTAKRKGIVYGDKSGKIRNPDKMSVVEQMQSGRGKKRKKS